MTRVISAKAAVSAPPPTGTLQAWAGGGAMSENGGAPITYTPGFRSKFVICMVMPTFGAPTATAYHGFGFCDVDAALAQYGHSGILGDQIDYSYKGQHASRILTRVNGQGDGWTVIGELTSVDATSFTVDPSVSTSIQGLFLALGGDDLKVSSDDPAIPATPGPVVVSGHDGTPDIAIASTIVLDPTSTFTGGCVFDIGVAKNGGTQRSGFSGAGSQQNSTRGDWYQSRTDFLRIQIYDNPWLIMDPPVFSAGQWSSQVSDAPGGAVRALYGASLSGMNSAVGDVALPAAGGTVNIPLSFNPEAVMFWGPHDDVWPGSNTTTMRYQQGIAAKGSGQFSNYGYADITGSGLPQNSLRHSVNTGCINYYDAPDTQTGHRVVSATFGTNELDLTVPAGTLDNASFSYLILG